MKILVAGPYIGELGYEVGNWMPHLAFQASHYDEVHSFTRVGRQNLYPFCSHVGTFNFPYNNHPDQHWMIAPKTEELNAYNALENSVHNYVNNLKHSNNRVNTLISNKSNRRIQYDKILSTHLQGNCDLREKWRKILPAGNKALIVYRAYKRGAKKNSNPDTIKQLCAILNKRGFIPIIVGKSDINYAPSSLPPVDLINKTTINDIIAILQLCRFAIGASTGTLHLASACKIPHIVWGGGRELVKQRYLHIWNPHKVYVDVLSLDWDIHLDIVTQSLDRMLNGILS